MSFEEIVQRVESRLLGLGSAAIQADPASELREQIDLTQGEQARLLDELEQARARVEELRRQLSEKEAAAALLPSLVESSFRRGKASQAMRQALELDRLRREIAIAQVELPRLEQACWCLEFRLRQLDHRLQRLREALGRR
jgi:chromosome segregation ATPase